MGNSRRTSINLGKSPFPRQSELDAPSIAFELGGEISLPRGRKPIADFFDVVLDRRTRYGGLALNVSQISALLRFVAQATDVRSSASGVLTKFRPVASAGARHPIDIGVCGIKGKGTDFFIYDDIEHTLRSTPRNSDFGAWLSQYASATTGGPHGTLFWFLAEPARTSSKYAHSASLIWRDAGALTQQFSLVAAALGLHCVPLGATGEPELSKRLVPTRARVGVGGCFVGVPPAGRT